MLADEEKGTGSERLRMCVACRRVAPRSDLVRLTVDHDSGEVFLSGAARASPGRRSGRSAYLCKRRTCLEQALKGTRLKFALEGRRVKGKPPKRRVAWPLEPQLIHDMSLRCTEDGQTCKNTQEKEGGE